MVINKKIMEIGVIIVMSKMETEVVVILEVNATAIMAVIIGKITMNKTKTLKTIAIEAIVEDVQVVGLGIKDVADIAITAITMTKLLSWKSVGSDEYNHSFFLS